MAESAIRTFAAESLAVNQHRETLAHRLLVTSAVMPPAPWADAYLMKNMLSQFSRDEAVVAAESTRYNDAGQTKLVEPEVYFVGRLWTWPKRGQRFLHWLKWLLLPRTVYRLVRYAQTTQCGAVFANFPNEHMLFAAYLTSVFLRLPLFAYFHNTYRENRRRLSYVFASWLQARIFRRARIVFVMSEGMKEVLQRRYPKVHFEPLVHTFSEAPTEFEPQPAISEREVRLAILGTINESNLDATRRACQVVHDSPDYQMKIYTGYAPWLLQKAGLLGPRVTHEEPADEELILKLRGNDFLILPHGFTGGLSSVEYDSIFPTRTIPYLLSGRPIIAHTPPGTFLTRWLRMHDCAQIVDTPSVDDLRRAIERLRSNPDRRSELVCNALRCVREFYAPLVVGRMKRQINSKLKLG